MTSHLTGITYKKHMKGPVSACVFSDLSYHICRIQGFAERRSGNRGAGDCTLPQLRSFIIFSIHAFLCSPVIASGIG